MKSFEIVNSSSLTINFTRTIRAKNRRDAQKAFDRLLDRGLAFGDIKIVLSDGGAVEWHGEPALNLRPKQPRRRRGKKRV